MNDASHLKKYQFSSENQPKKKNGRKPSVLKKVIKNNGISSQDLEYAFKYCLGKSRKELQNIIKDENESIVIVSAASALLNDIKNGKLSNISTVMRKANVDPEQTGESDSAGLGGADTSSHEQFHEYEFPNPDSLPS